MTDADTMPRPAVHRRMPKRVFTTAIALVVWLVVPWWIILGAPGEGEGPGMFAVCLVFSLISLGVAGLCVVLSLRARGRGTAPPLETALAERVQTASGELPMRQAAVQVLLVPAAVLIGFALLAVVDAVERI